MTYDDDFIRINGQGFFLKDLKLEWPPPERLTFTGFEFREWREGDDVVWVLNRRSQITDEERATMTHVCRGAEYFPETNS